MHYDTPHNIYLQVVGSKRVLLWPPEEYLSLYMKGDKSIIPQPHRLAAAAAAGTAAAAAAGTAATAGKGESREDEQT